MATPTLVGAGIAVLRSRQTYLVFSLITKQPTFDVVEAYKAAAERERAAELVEAESAELKTIEKRIEEFLEEAQKKSSPPPPPKLPEPPPPKLPQPGPNANGEAITVRNQFQP